MRRASPNRNGQRAETYVQRHLEKSSDWVIPLAPSFPADILRLRRYEVGTAGASDHRVGWWPIFYEVKSRRRVTGSRGRTLAPYFSPLTVPEAEFRGKCANACVEWCLVKVLTTPTQSTVPFEIVGWGGNDET